MQASEHFVFFKVFRMVFIIVIICNSTLYSEMVQCDFFSFLLKFIFNWRIIALQYYVSFCHISVRVSHRYTLEWPFSKSAIQSYNRVQAK